MIDLRNLLSQVFFVTADRSFIGCPFGRTFTKELGMKIVSGVLSLVAGFALASSAYAGVCELTVTRVACAGQEAASYKKCDGKASCAVKKKADNEAACVKAAEEECVNSRTEITKSKTVSAKFDGKEVKNAAGSNQFCAADRPDFNKCK